MEKFHTVVSTLQRQALMSRFNGSMGGSGVRGARCCGTRVRARAFDRASFDAHAGPLRCRCAVPRSSDGSTVAAHEENTAASAAGKRLSVWSAHAQSSCNCIDHQTFACLCMRGLMMY